MALPALRQPKFATASPLTVRKPVFSDPNYMILTLKNGVKLVVASDAYHGIITEEEMYKCVFCASSLELGAKNLQLHKDSVKHKGIMADVPYIEGFADHLMRQINKNESYCTICNVLLPSYAVARHILTEVHTQESNKAHARGLAYKPYSQGKL